MENWKKRIGQKIQKRRVEMGFKTQGDLANAMDVDISRISRWETGENVPKKHKKILYEKLKINDDFLYSSEPSPKEPDNAQTKSKIISEVMSILFTMTEDELRAILALVSKAPSQGLPKQTKLKRG